MCSFVSNSGVHDESQSMCLYVAIHPQIVPPSRKHVVILGQVHTANCCASSAQDPGDWQTYYARLPDAHTRAACENVPEDTRMG